jgi:hypothetical protein
MDQPDQGEIDKQIVEQETSIRKVLKENGLETAQIMIDFLMGKRIEVKEEPYQLKITPGERLERLKVIGNYLSRINVDSSPGELIKTFNGWLDKDNAAQLNTVPVGDWGEGITKVVGRSLYGGASKELGVYYTDKQHV